MLKHFLIVLSAAALIGCSPAPPAKAPEAAPIAQPSGDPAGSAPVSPTTVNSPAPYARVTSPLTVTGVARGWYFEGSFPAKLVGADGQVIAQAPAQAAGRRSRRLLPKNLQHDIHIVQVSQLALEITSFLDRPGHLPATGLCQEFQGVAISFHGNP
jgi:hypothetical protein